MSQLARSAYDVLVNIYEKTPAEIILSYDDRVHIKLSNSFTYHIFLDMKSFESIPVVFEADNFDSNKLIIENQSIDVLNLIKLLLG